MADKAEQTVSLSAVMELIKQMHEDNLKASREMGQTIAYGVTHPEPTEKEKQAREENRNAMIDLAKMQEETKKRKRIRCPHKRVGHTWGMFNNTSVIAWHYTNFTSFDEHKMHQVGPTVAIGVCQWCQSEFKPGDPDYMEKLSWGVSPTQSFQMDAINGNWLNG